MTGTGKGTARKHPGFAASGKTATSLANEIRSAGRDPHDRDLSDLVSELSTHSDAFRTRWAAHDVRFHKVGVTHFHHPVVGELSVSLNRFDLPTDDGQTLFAYTAEPGSRSEEALRLLGSWTASVAPAEPARAIDQRSPRGPQSSN